MSHQPPRQYSAATHRAVNAIEWEELPSLVKRVQRASPDSRFQTSDSSWGATAPGGLETVPASLPVVERVEGLATREVIEPDVFRHFFGPDAE